MASRDWTAWLLDWPEPPVPSTHLAREGRMTVTIDGGELLAALGGAAAAWPLAARGQQPFAAPGSLSADENIRGLGLYSDRSQDH
jgi:hypothetical protein